MGTHDANIYFKKPENHGTRIEHYQGGAKIETLWLPDGLSSYTIRHHLGSRGVDTESPQISRFVWGELEAAESIDELLSAAQVGGVKAWLMAQGLPFVSRVHAALQH